ncbi:metallophosphoesterase [Methanolobus bombayensis]|uniref:metallophosphoesterase n=1 Tax=Methanolobus bombayensis TaxID=38023 RepID=UPI001AE22C53|nr:metallophosphoesterase [Methanolobus bombayensis]MBP1909249.1 putative phosphoesterase [Methanolobus bombayensis]
MKIIVISDTHLDSEEIPSYLSELFEKYEMIIHAGDFDTFPFYKALESTGKLKAVHGNSDEPAVRDILPEKLIFEVEGVKIGVIHQASLSIVDNTATRYMALEMGVDILVFGHIHRPVIEKSDVLLICPGSPTKPRMSDPCAVELEIENGSVKTNVIPITGQSCEYIDFSRSLGENE